MSWQIGNKSKEKIISDIIGKLVEVTQKLTKTMALQTVVVTQKLAKMTTLLCCSQT
jgi:hypothetical protein